MAVSEIAGAIQELVGLVREWIKSAPSRNTKNAIKNAEKYIIANETLTGEYKEKKLERYKYKFNKYKLG